MISVIIPVFNEADSIEQCLKAVAEAPYEKQIIVVDDASTDGTSKKLLGLRDKMGFTLIIHSRNQGKGAAIKSAQAVVSGTAVIIQDGDLEYDPKDYPVVLEPILSGKEKVVYGSRRLKKNQWNSLAFYLGGQMITVIGNLLYGIRLTDLNTCYKGFEAELFKKIPLAEPRFNFCEEVTAKVSRMGAHIVEVPINYYPRTIKQGKKIRPIDAVRSIATLIKYKAFKP
ncbi:MAG: glycosyltransferase family 2 protein [Patescibacteria group bacterium]|nr:glycosyltransferase family 2 protein [Patescibacteria group bacterium]MCL5261765.1 glycosyltransferase family 2 protein [Patescibacteria group bacterium]